MTETPSVRPWLALAAAAVMACSPGEGTQAPDVPDIRGTYEGLWDMSMVTLDASSQQGAECRGTVTVESQTDTTFAGAFRVDSAGQATGDLSCRVIEGDVVNGRHGASGLASFRPVVNDGGVAAALSGCEGSASWQADFTRTPDRPSDGRLDAGSKLTLRCEQGDGSSRSWEAQIQFRGSQQ